MIGELAAMLSGNHLDEVRNYRQNFRNNPQTYKDQLDENLTTLRNFSQGNQKITFTSEQFTDDVLTSSFKRYRDLKKHEDSEAVKFLMNYSKKLINSSDDKTSKQT